MSLERREIRIIQPGMAKPVPAGAIAISGGEGGARVRPALAEADLRLTPLSREHIPAICAIEQHSYSNPWSDPFIASEFDKDVSFRPAFFYGQELIGYSFNYIVADELHILNLAVHPRFRRQKIGSRLLAAILEGGIERKCSFATLEVRVSNLAARRMYERFGFRPVSIRRGYYSDNGEDALILDRSLGASTP